jgi:exosome complex component RRP42
MTSLSTSSSSSSAAVLLSQSERDFILAGCREDCRVDGRKCNEFRKFTILTGNEQQQQQQQHHGKSSSNVIHHVELNQQNQSQPQLVLSAGSARLVSTCGSTHLLCSVKAEVVRPTRQAPRDGVVELHVETLHSGNGSGSAGGGMSRRDCDELAVILSRLLFPSQSSSSSSSSFSSSSDTSTTDDTSRQSLCILPHIYVWRLHVDLYLLAAGGGSLLDAASHVIRAALDNTLLPAITTNTNTNSSAALSLSSWTREDAANATNVELLVDGDIQKARRPAIDAPMIVSVAVLHCRSRHYVDHDDNDDDDDAPRIALLSDATAEEESCANAIVHVAVNYQKNASNNGNKQHKTKNDDNDDDDDAAQDSAFVVTAIQKSLPGSLPIHLLPQIMTTALQGARTILCTPHEQQMATSTAVATVSNHKLPSTQRVQQHFSFLQEQFVLQS